MIVSSCEGRKVTPGGHSKSCLATTREQQGLRVLTVVEDDGAMDTGFQEVLKELKS